MFVALRGEKADGHQFIGQAIDKGASVIVAEREQKDPRVTSLVVENTRTALADFSATFYGHPARKLKLAAVTGTNGKTTTTFLIKHICENAGLRCGLIGTVRYEIGERILPAIRTTPESLDLQELLAQIANAGCKAAAMEVSSHALAQERTRGIEWNVAVFTNLTQDHLDFHGTMENYFEAKAKLFTELAGQKQKTKPLAIVNIDDRYGQQLLDKLDKNVAVITYGMGSRADFRASNMTAFALVMQVATILFAAWAILTNPIILLPLTALAVFFAFYRWYFRRHSGISRQDFRDHRPGRRAPDIGVAHGGCLGSRDRRKGHY